MQYWGYGYPADREMRVVSFTQDYRSDHFKNVTRKRQYWANMDGVWKIIYETELEIAIFRRWGSCSRCHALLPLQVPPLPQQILTNHMTVPATNLPTRSRSDSPKNFPT